MKMVQIIVCAGCTFPRASPNLILRFPSFICVIGNTRPLLLLVLSFPSPDPVLKSLGKKNQEINFISTYYSKYTSYYLYYLVISRGQKFCEFINTFLNSRGIFQIHKGSHKLFRNRDKGNQVENHLNFLDIFFWQLT